MPHSFILLPFRYHSEKPVPGASIVITMPARFDAFARLCDALAATTRKLEKRTLIANALRGMDTPDSALTALYLAGTPFPETDRRSLNVGGSLLSKALAEASHANRQAMHAAYRRYGDLGCAASDLLADHKPSGEPLTLEYLERAFGMIATARGPGAKLPTLLDLLRRAEPVEAKYLIKLATGDMRTGVKQSLVEEAIADAYGSGVAEVRRAVALQGDLQAVVTMAAEGRLAEATMKLFHPLGFMLASPVESVAKAVERFTEETGKTEAPLRQVTLEDKYDGIRAQLHCGDPAQPGRVELFSRNREDIGASFPELRQAFARFDEPVILDGEILAWNSREERAMPFSALQQRLGRKQVSAEMLEQMPVVYVVFDLLYRGDLLLERPLYQRRAQLQALVERLMPDTLAGEQEQPLLFADAATPAFARLRLAPAVHLQSEEQLERAYIEARQRGNEGVMLKDVASTYQPGRRGLAWLKLKRELATLDVVVTGVEFGHGKRAGVLSDYTFAVRDGNALRNVGKAYSGLTDAEIAELTTFFRRHTLEDFGSFRTVEPLKVIEVAFNNIMRSSRHNSGFALRFPRILRIRDDKPVNEIDTLARVEEIFNAQPDKMIEPDLPLAP